MEKVKLTEAQVDALETYKRDGHDVETFSESSKYWNNEYAPIKDLSIDDFAKAFYAGYEVEPEYKVGDWVKFWKNDCLKAVGEIKSKTPTEVLIQLGDIHFHHTKPDNITRHATPEEIKAEQERRVWKSIGREVGGFRDGDVILLDDKRHFRVQDEFAYKNNEVDLKTAEMLYEDIDIVGFYPAESFIEFGGEDE